MLVPTGKAALRVQQEACFPDAQTIDRFLYTVGLGDCLQDMETLLDPPSANVKEKVQNIIIDESSMVDLQRLATLVQLIQQKGRTSLKRLILIGDENQLPPIGVMTDGANVTGRSTLLPLPTFSPGAPVRNPPEVPK